MFGLPLCASFLLLTVVKQLASRKDVQHILNQQLLPSSEYGNRIAQGGSALGLPSECVITGSDPILSRTYGEFPLDSLDTLLDAAETYDRNNGSTSPVVVDLGSGFGRLCFYMAFTRAWDVHGIEISEILHQEALQVQDKAVEAGLLIEQSNENEARLGGSLAFHCGPASQYAQLLKQADLIFCYSTAFQSDGFSPEVGAMTLADEWNELLSKHCQSNCLVITTDRAIDPSFGWKVLQRIDVLNPEVWGSTGYLQRLLH